MYVEKSLAIFYVIIVIKKLNVDVMVYE